MLVVKGGFPALNAIGIVKGTFQCSPGDYESSAIELVASYMHHPSGVTFGTCPFKGGILSQRSREKLAEFLRSAEEDFRTVLKMEKGAPPGSINDITFPSKV